MASTELNPFPEIAARLEPGHREQQVKNGSRRYDKLVVNRICSGQTARRLIFVLSGCRESGIFPTFAI
jgi:hypothetical protein